MARRSTALFFSIFLIAAASGSGVAEEVMLDGAFGSGGLVTTELGAGIDTATSIAVQDDGKIIVAGSSDNGLGSKMAVVRYLPDGSIDHEFSFSMGGSLGTVYADDTAQAVALGDNGRILLGGTLTDNGVRQGAVISLLPYGQLDASFGVGGIASVGAGAVESEIYDVIIDAGGRIVVTGSIYDGMTERPLVARFSGNGEPDSGFHQDGTLIDTLIEGRGTGLAESADGSVIIGGYSIRDGEWKGLYLSRYLENGDPDDQFGEEGRSVWFDDVEQISVHDIALTADETIILAGDVETADGQRRIMLARYVKEGQPDPGFGENGILVYDSGMDSSLNSLVVNPDSTIIGAGYQTSASGKDMVIIRYRPGTAALEMVDAAEPATDADMAGDEPVEMFRISPLSIEDGPLNIPVEDQEAQNPEADLITTELAGSDEVSNAVLLSEDASIYTAGYSGDDDNSAFMVARYSGLVGEGVSVDSGSPSVSEFYRIGTMPVTNVTRVAAMSGGTIVLNDTTDSAVCIEACEESCEDAEDNATCLSECRENCQVPTVTQRGVVYSVEPNPVYDENTTDSDGDTEDITESVTDESGDEADDDTVLGSGNFFSFDDYFVKNGQTEDGSGVDTYVSEIEGITPQTVYYVRAYGLLSDGTVIYGNEYRFETDDSCFIATAAFGSIDMFAVKALRSFRDRYLVPYEWGQLIVHTYYFLSPTIADLVEQSFFLRLLIILLLTPAVASAVFLVYTTLLMKCVVIISVPLAWYFIAFHKKQYGIVHA